MNPWALLVILLGLLLIIIGVKGSQHEVVTTITGKTATKTPSKKSGKNSPPVMQGPVLT